MNLQGKVVLITGASSGIGESLTRQLQKMGSKLILIARRKEKLDQLAKELNPDGKQVIAIQTDITDNTQLEKAFTKGIAAFNDRLDVVINNAGLGYFGPLSELSMEVFDQIIKTNVYAPLQLSQLSLPYLKNTSGMIVNISSALSKRALPFLTPYAASKSMLDALSDGMRLEFRKYGIKVLTYCPPEVDTGFAESAIKSGNLNHSTSTRKKATPEEVARRIIKAIEEEKREVVEGKSLQVMNFFAPKLVDNMFYKGMVLRLSKD